MRRQLVLSNWTEKFMIQNQSKSVDELWNSFKSEIHEIRNRFVPKQLSGIPSWKKIRVACQLIKSFVILYGAKVNYTSDRYHQKMF